MAELYIDLRNDAAVALLVEKGAVVYGRVFTQWMNDGEALRQLVATLRAEGGADFKKAHLLVPASEVVVTLHRTQAKEMADARLIIGRAVAQETGEATPCFLLTRMAAEHNQQVYLTEALPRLILEKYLVMFREAHLRLVTLSTAFQARQAFLAEMRGEIHEVQALFNLDKDGGIEATYFSNTELFQHEVLAGAGGHAVADDGDEERSGRRRLYETMNNLHIVYSRFMNQHPQAVVGKLWLGGTGCDIAGGAAGLAEALRAEVGLLIPAEVKDLPEPQAYIATAGLLRLLQSGAPVNFLPRELRKPFQINTRLLTLGGGGFLAVVLAVSMGVNERRYATAKRQLADEQLAVQSLLATSGRVQEQLRELRKIREIAGKQLPIYDVFRELTVLLPPGVYLEGVECFTSPGKDEAEVRLSTAMVYDDEFGSRRLLSQYVAALDASTVLSRQEEPVITYRELGERKLLVAAITCKVTPRKSGE